MPNTIRVNSIRDNYSLCDGPGLRTVVFLQGCKFHCKGCHNKSTWNPCGGTAYKIEQLASILRQKCFNKKLTITGGEPLLQKEEVLELCRQLKDFDLCLYTGYELDDVPKEILEYLRFVKTGLFDQSKVTSLVPFVGSTNQKFLEVKHA